MDSADKCSIGYVPCRILAIHSGVNFWQVELFGSLIVQSKDFPFRLTEFRQIGCKSRWSADKQRHQQRYHSNHLFPLIDTALHTTVGNTTRRSVRGGMLKIVLASLGGRHYGAHRLGQAFVFFMQRNDLVLGG